MVRKLSSVFRVASITACVALVSASICLAQVKLERKLKEDSTYTVETATKFDQTLNIAGMDVDTKSENRATVKATVGKRGPDGKLPVQEKVEALKVSTEVMGTTYEFDSANPDDKGASPLEMFRDVHKILAKRATTTVYDKDNLVESVKSDKDDIGSLPVEVQNYVKGQLDPEAMKKEANEQLKQLPKEPVKPGDTWQATAVANFGAGQLMTFQTEYKYEGTVEKDGKTLDKISSKVLTVDYALKDSPLPFTLKSADLKPKESQGVLLFDRELGRVVEGNSATRITGDIIFVAGGTDLPAKLDLKMHNTTTVKP